MESTDKRTATESSLAPRVPRRVLPREIRIDLLRVPRIDLPRFPRIDLPRLPRIDLPRVPRIDLPRVPRRVLPREIRIDLPGFRRDHFTSRVSSSHFPSIPENLHGSTWRDPDWIPPPSVSHFGPLGDPPLNHFLYLGHPQTGEAEDPEEAKGMEMLHVMKEASEEALEEGKRMEKVPLKKHESIVGSLGGGEMYGKGSLCDLFKYRRNSPGSIWDSCSSAADAPPGDNQDVTIGKEMNEASGPSISDDSYSAAGAAHTPLQVITKHRGSRKHRRASTDPYFRLPKRKDREDDDPRCKSVRKASCSQSINPTVAEPLCAQDRPAVIQDLKDLTGFPESGVAQDAFEFSSAGSESEAGGGGNIAMEMDAPVAAVSYTVTNTLPERGRLPPPWSSRSASSCRSRSHSFPSLSGITSVENETFRRAESSPDMLLRSSAEEFTPDISEDENDETYRFQCSCPGLYRCSVTGLQFHMAGEGVVVYRTVPWDRRLLAGHHKKPAGPLFEIKCEQQSVRGLHLPHCEVRSAGGCDFLSVAHVKDEGDDGVEGVEFIGPREVTETHVVVNIAGFSAYGITNDENSPPVPVRALVLLFYRSPVDLDPEALLNVLLLPRNVALRDVLRMRKKIVGDESYIETSPHCKLTPGQEYTLITRSENDQVLVQPTEAEFDSGDYDNYFPSFQVTWETTLNHIKLLLRDAISSLGVWERRVCLSSAGVRRSCGPSVLDLPPAERLLVVRSRFVEGISEPMLKSLLDKLLEKAVMTDAEKESANEMPNVREKARFVIDTVRKKGEAAGSEMIEILCEADPVLCEHLGLI